MAGGCGDDHFRTEKGYDSAAGGDRAGNGEDAGYGTWDEEGAGKEDEEGAGKEYAGCGGGVGEGDEAALPSLFFF